MTLSFSVIGLTASLQNYKILISLQKPQLCIGQINVWRYLEKIDSNLDEITSDYFQVLRTGLKL